VVIPGDFDRFGYWRYSPLHYSSFGFGYYDPWWYGHGYGYYPGRWNRYPYGFGYGLLGYFPYAGYYDPYVPYGYGGSYYGGSYRDDDRDSRRMGSIRLRVSPRVARVYIDGALVGTVDDFDGLVNHLDVEAGAHQLELRADGYEPYSTDITVAAGKTMTERAKLKRTGN
jgi:hypothetical protein